MGKISYPSVEGAHQLPPPIVAAGPVAQTDASSTHGAASEQPRFALTQDASVAKQKMFPAPVAAAPIGPGGNTVAALRRAGKHALGKSTLAPQGVGG